MLSQEPSAAVLVLLWGSPPHVLLERKSCSVASRFACDVALPGGRIKNGETPEEAALREAWEEAWVCPSMVRVLGRLGVFSTASEPKIYTMAILAEPWGPIDVAPRDPEVDAVFWVNLEHVKKPSTVLHRRRQVQGVKLGKDLVVWGLTLRILTSLGEEMATRSVKDFKGT
ncbi:MAG: CoA pyrophosphatase [Acidilobus sp.]